MLLCVIQKVYFLHLFSQNVHIIVNKQQFTKELSLYEIWPKSFKHFLLINYFRHTFNLMNISVLKKYSLFALMDISLTTFKNYQTLFKIMNRFICEFFSLQFSETILLGKKRKAVVAVVVCWESTVLLFLTWRYTFSLNQFFFEQLFFK